MNLQALRSAAPRAPFEFQEEVELYARESGRTAKIHFVPGGGWFVRFSLRCNDPAMQLFQQGLAAEPPSEDVWFHVDNPNPQEGVSLADLKAMDLPILWQVVGLRGNRCRQDFIPLDILQMGVSGVREFLEKGNTWSGRGLFRSLQEQHRKGREKNQQAKGQFKARQREENRYQQRETRRQRLKIPFLRVLKDLRGK